MTTSRREESKRRIHESARRHGLARVRVSLRLRQWQVAQQGDVAMLIWLGRQWLGQRDNDTPHGNAEICEGPTN